MIFESENMKFCYIHICIFYIMCNSLSFAFLDQNLFYFILNMLRCNVNSVMCISIYEIV